ncbi:MAG: tyrosine-protein phosphatase [Bacilli bacterium]|nr:tyrosine-protein phosphatase [Bacilli bacterium]
MKKNFVLLASTAMLLAACGGNKPAGNSEEAGAKVIDGVITLTKNNDGKEVSILHERTQAYIDAMYEAEEAENLDEEDLYKMRDNACGTVNPADYQGPEGENDQDHFMPIKLEWNYAGYSGQYKVKYATNKMLTGAKELTVTANSAELVNLFTDTTYYWQVQTADGAHDSKVGSFHTKGHFRMMESGLAYNVRDFGGKMTKSGRRIKQGLIYRGGELTEEWFDTGSKQKHIITLDTNTKNIFLNTMNIKTDLDFRAKGNTTNNITTSPLNHDLGDDDTIKASANVVWNNQACGSLTGFWGQQQAMLNNIYTTFMNATEEAAVYCHCWGGADRTGTAFFILEGLLGVSYTECLMDYELTSFDNIHLRRRNAQVTDENGYSYNFPSLPAQIKKDYPNWATMDFSEICADWMESRAGFSKEQIEQLRENLLEPEE